MQDILINWAPQETRVAIVENGAVQELHIERALERGLVGNIYTGRVARVLPGMQSAFVDIGLERAAFLHVADVHVSGAPPRGDAAQQVPIERLVFEGQTLMVQVIKDAIGTKGARLSTQISIAGRLLVHLPQDRHVGISQRIESTEEREALRARIHALLPLEDPGGYIVRTMAESASDEELAADIAYLRKTWQEIRNRAKTAKPPTLVFEDLTLAQRVLRDLACADTQSIQVDSRENYVKLRSFAEEYMPQLTKLLEHYTGERPLFELHSVEEEIEKALARRVDLKSGGYLIFDQTEAMTTIDVNTGGFVGSRNFDETIFKTNLEAAHQIARHLRLRNLGGIILIDFIDMESEEHRAQVLAELHKALGRDHTKISVSGFTSLGLVEMTRKRTRESLAHMLCEPCVACGGQGIVKTARSVAYDVMREILREARQFTPREFRIVSSPQVIELFLDEESQHLAGLSDFIGKPISLQSEPAIGQGQYDIVLL